MLRFEELEARIAEFSRQFKEGRPYEHLVIDGFCDDARLSAMYDLIPDPIEEGLNKSRDYMFARNKYEKSGFKDISPEFAELHGDLMSERFQRFLQQVTGEAVFVDPAFHGGGIHQGGAGSFLDMHVDFNTHPAHKDWFRNLNILLYLNRGWRPEHKGELKLRHKDHPEETVLVQPLFNRCVIMFTRDYTVHGYDAINFPEGKYRRSIAAYAYSPLKSDEVGHRSTVWYPDSAGVIKSTVGRIWPTLVAIKGKIAGSGTGKNK
jgi:hypothetical protein